MPVDCPVITGRSEMDAWRKCAPPRDDGVLKSLIYHVNFINFTEIETAVLRLDCTRYC